MCEYANHLDIYLFIYFPAAADRGDLLHRTYIVPNGCNTVSRATPIRATLG
jgi:hypothetical protein